MKKLILLIIIIAIGWYVYKHHGQQAKKAVHNITNQASKMLGAISNNNEQMALGKKS